jgi:transposase, IS5 family
MHSEEDCVGADAGYVGAVTRELKWRIAERRKPLKELTACWQKDLALAYEKLKARIRTKVEHPFPVVKSIFQHKKTRYKGIAKKDAQLHVLFALSNLYMVRGKFCP